MLKRCIECLCLYSGDMSNTDNTGGITFWKLRLLVEESEAKKAGTEHSMKSSKS